MTESARRALLLTALLLLPVSASAQTLAEDQASEDGEQADALGSGSGAAVVTVDSGHSLSDEQAVLEEDEPAVAPDDGIDPTEHENTDYFSAGAIFRGIIIPDFMQRLFVDYRGGTPINAGMGAY